MNYNNDIYIPKFMACSCHEDPTLNYIIHTEFPRFMVEVADSFNDDDIFIARENKQFFTKVTLDDGSHDLLVVVAIFDNVDITDEKTFNIIHDTIDKMCKWHKKEILSLKTLNLTT